VIIVISTIEVREGRRDQFLRLFFANSAYVRALDECDVYAVSIDVNVDEVSSARENTLTIIEHWCDFNAYTTNLASRLMQSFRENTEE
jgi:quinol monooxygenase YgiN